MSYAPSPAARRVLTRDDLLGCPAISYLRFSSAPQEKGSSIDRQQKTLDRTVEHFQLVLDRSLVDRALSASKGHNRKRGNLRLLLDAARRGDFRGTRTVLVVEAMDRLTREGVLDVFPVLGDLVRNGLVIVTGDYHIWDEVSINGDGNHKLLAEINAAGRYTSRLSEFATGAHKRRREKITEFSTNPEAEVPEINGRPPGWIIKNDEGKSALCPVHGPVIKRIFEMYASGSSVRQIAATLNGENIPVMRAAAGGPARVWEGSRISAILRDDHVLGYYQPIRWNDGKRVIAGPKVKAYPAAITADLWVAVERARIGSKKLLGRRGGDVAMLFTGKAFCPTCGGKLRMATGGGIRKGRRPRDLLCVAYTESKTCADKQRYDMWYFEPRVLTELLLIADILPAQPTCATRLSGDLAAVQLEIANREQSMDAIAAKVGQIPALMSQLEKLAQQTAELKKQARDLEVRIAAAATQTSRAQTTRDALKTLIKPALAQDADARIRLRNLLASLDYRIDGREDGGLTVTSGGQTKDISHPRNDLNAVGDDVDIDGVATGEQPFFSDNA